MPLEYTKVHRVIELEARLAGGQTIAPKNGAVWLSSDKGQKFKAEVGFSGPFHNKLWVCFLLLT